jgi:ferritin
MEKQERRRVTYISDEIAELFVKQIQHEKQNHLLYKNIAIWCDVRGLCGNAKYFNVAAEGELQHAKVVCDHLIESSYDFCIPTLEEQEVPAEGETPLEQLKSLHEAALTREIETTELILNICKVSLEKGDYISFNAIQPLVIEQREEENKQSTALDQFEFTEDLILLDKKIKKLA